MFSDSLQLVGGLDCGATPVPEGPRQLGQSVSPARAGLINSEIIAAANVQPMDGHDRTAAVVERLIDVSIDDFPSKKCVDNEP